MYIYMKFYLRSLFNLKSAISAFTSAFRLYNVNDYALLKMLRCTFRMVHDRKERTS